MTAKALSPGNHVGPYVILERLGAGGMGEVYLGRDTRLHRKVALKCVLDTGSGDEAQRLRILHEARAAARINHGNVAAVHDVIEQEARAFIVMEFVEGESLAARLRRGRLAPDAVVSIGRQLTAALTAAHAEGVVHRDLKPANIQLTPAGAVKILDFGVAKSTRPLLPNPSAATITESSPDGQGPLAGTPAYMAPEQVLGEPVDARTDIYGLGVVLFELATGRRPYEYIDPLELIQPSASLAPRADDVDRTVPPRLASIIATTLQRDPKLRYQSVEELDAALAEFQREVGEQRGRTWRRWTAAVAAATALAIGAIAIVRDRGEPFPPPASIRSIAVLPLVNLSGQPSQEYFVDGMTDGLINTLGRLSALKVIARTSVMGFKRTTRSVADIAKELHVDAVLEGSAQLASNGSDQVRVSVNLIDPRTQTQLWSDTIERDLSSVLAIQAEIASTIAEKIRVFISPDERQRLASASTVDPETYKLFLLGRHELMGRTAPQLQRALEYFKQAIARSPDHAPAHAGLADTYVLLAGDFGAVPREEGAAQAIAAASRALEIDPGLAEAHTSLAFTMFFLKWDWSAAEHQFQRALELNPSYATAHHWYGNFLSDIGREEEALTEIRRALELDPLSPIISRDVAWPLFFSRRYDEAIAQLNVTLTTHPGYLAAERLRARVLAQKGSTAEAIRAFQQQKARGDTPRARCELAWAYALAGRRRDAHRELQSALGQKTGVYHYDVALVHTALDQIDEAFQSLDRAYEERDPTMVNLRHDPRFDRLRSDPRYERLVALMRFPTR